MELHATGNKGAGTTKTISPLAGAQGFNYDPNTHIATWTFAELPADKYRIQIAGHGVEDMAGNLLDGHWENDTNDTPDDFSDDVMFRTFVSGNGMPGDPFQFFFSLLAGDYDQNGIVNGLDDDPGIVKDGDGDGDVDAADTSIATMNNGQRLFLWKADRGDYFDDEFVDIHDYMVWRGLFGGGGLAADGSGNGVVDAADYVVWRNWVNTLGAWYEPPTGVGSLIPIVDFGNAPRVANVTISGSQSTHAPYSFGTADGSGEQLRTVPVGGVDSVSITFSEDVNVDASYLSVVGLYTANVPTLAAFSYDMASMTATWRFDDLIPNDRYALTLSDAVTDIEGNRLDGEWVNPASLTTTNAAVSEFPSGNSIAGGDFVFVITLLASDFNHDYMTEWTDYEIWQANEGAISSGATHAQGDANGDGDVDEYDDYVILTSIYDIVLDTVGLLADLDGDFDVDGFDVQILDGNVGMSNPTRAHGDLNGDGLINWADVDLAFAQYGLNLEVVA
jgi:hypothetical protein